MASRTPPAQSYDVVVIGSGAAGLTAALNLAERFKVVVLAKGDVSAGSTAWAQGGIAAVLEPGDTYESHIEDTMIAGGGLNDRATVEYVVEHAARAIDRLAALGVPFNPGETVSERWHLTREGGHSHRRIVHVDDATGWAVQEALARAAAAHPNITLASGQVAIDLITERHVAGERFARRGCHGVYAYDLASKRVRRFAARAVVLATGGASRVYQYSTNPDGSTGDGIAMAWRAGCRVSNMEFNQFHPTCLYHPLVKNFLITEAMRGEGGRLLLPDGTRLMERHDPERMELAPRDVVARAIDAEMKRLGLSHVLLDMTHLAPEFIRHHFPMIHARLLELGIDCTVQPIPVVPAAHYTCGGVLVDLAGRTDLAGLYAAGRSPSPACTGPTGWRRTRSSNAWCSARRSPTTSPVCGNSCRSRRRSCRGTKAASPIPTRRSSSPITGRNCGASCGIMSASCEPTNASNGPPTGSSCCARRSPITTAISASRPTSSSSATSCRWRT